MVSVDKTRLDFDEVLKDWANGLIEKIRHNMENENINASGETSASLEYVLTNNGIMILGAPYFAERTEVGRTPTKNHQSFDFTSVIAKWIKNKNLDVQWGLDKERDVRNIAYVISQNISKLGSSKYRGDRPQTDVYSTAVAEAVDDLSQKLLTGSGEKLLGMMDELIRIDGDKVGTVKIK